MLALGCGKTDDGGTGPGGTMTIALSITPATISVEQGGSANITGTVTTTGGFSGTITVTIEGAPTGVTGTVSNLQTSGGMTTATLTFAVDQSATPSTYTLTIRAAGSGVSDATTSLALTVLAAPFNLAINSGPISIEQGANSSAQIDIDRNNFSDPVTFTLENTPSGVSGDFAPNPATGDNTVLTVNVDNSVPPGTYQMTVRGTAGGHADQTTMADLTVISFSGTSLVVDWSGCPVSERPVWVAQQDGSGPWVPITGTNHVYTFNFTLSAVGIAVALDDGASSEINVDYALTSELPSETVVECPVETFKTINLTVAGLGPNDHAGFNLGGGLGGTLVNGPLQIQNTPPGSHDLVGYKREPEAPGSTDRMVIRRDQDIPDGGTFGTVDFAGSEAFDPITATMTVTGLAPGDSLSATTLFNTSTSANSCYKNGLFGDILGLGVATYTAYGPPGANLDTGDFYSVQFGVNKPTSVISIFEDFATMADRTIALPAELPMPVITPQAGPYKCLNASLNLPVDYDWLEFSYTTSSGASRNVSLTAPHRLVTSVDRRSTSSCLISRRSPGGTTPGHLPRQIRWIGK